MNITVTYMAPILNTKKDLSHVSNKAKVFLYPLLPKNPCANIISSGVVILIFS